MISLRDSIHSDIKWFKSKEDVLKFISDSHKKVFKDWYWGEDGADGFFDKIKKYCGGKVRYARKKKDTFED